MDFIEILFAILVITHSGAITLGVGASTIAIAGFLTAIVDGTFDPSERRIMGVVYISLRVAMITILLMSLGIFLMRPDFFGEFTLPMWVLVAVLYVNAFLMTKHLISMQVGPALQAGTWYTLGFLLTIYVFNLFPLASWLSFSIFFADVALGVLTVHICMQYAKRHKSAPQTPEQHG